MTTVAVRIPTPLRSFTGGADEVQVQGDTVTEALKALDEGLQERVLGPDDKIRHFVNIYLGPDNVNSLEGLETRLKEGDLLSIVPAVAGGSHESKRPAHCRTAGLDT